jgi:hypothetical protein
MSADIKFTIVRIEKLTDGSISFSPEYMHYQIPIINLLPCPLTKELFIEVRFQDNGSIENLDTITAYAQIIETPFNKYLNETCKLKDEANINNNLQMNYCKNSRLILRYPLDCFKRIPARSA